MTDQQAFAAVAKAAGKDTENIDPRWLGSFLPAVALAVAKRRRIPRTALDGFEEIGRDAAERGVAIRALLGLYQSAAWRLWRVLDEVNRPRDAAAVAHAGESVLRAVADVSAALIEGFQLARRALVRAESAARREFVDDLLLGGAQAISSLMERSARFGLNLSGPHAVLVAQADAPFVDHSPLLGRVERALLGSKADADALVSTKDGRLVLVFAAPDREAVAFVGDELARLLTELTGWQAGVGRPHTGPAGVRVAYEEALEALELGVQADLPGPLFDAADLLVHRVLIRDVPAMHELIDAVLTPLGRARGGAEPLLDTLEAYFAAGGNATAAAKTLHLSVRALTYRLARIAELTGRDPVNADDRFVLQTALFGARLLGTDLTPESS